MNVVKTEIKTVTISLDIGANPGGGLVTHVVGRHPNGCLDGHAIHWEDIPKYIEFLKVVHEEEKKHAEK